jgi:threonyl-tRNA synthetase
LEVIGLVKITLPDGSIKEFPRGTTVLEVAQSIGSRLAKAALAGRVNGHYVDLNYRLEGDAKLAIITFADQAGKDILRHSAAHVMAEAVQRVFPEAKLAIGPAIADGFYYDFEIDGTFSPEDLERIEAEMKKIIAADLPFERLVVDRDKNRQLFAKKGEKYKVELLDELDALAPVTNYRHGDFVDLCAGPHVPSTGRIKAFKLLSVAGAYWRGSEKNRMLQRIYGTAFEKQTDLDAYLERLEEAKRRDHRRLGKELDLFSIQEEGPGFPFFHPKGMVLRNILEDFWRAVHRKWGYQEVRTPIILHEDLWKQSGHWDHYQENMYFTKIDDEGYAIKPMNCPGGILLYKRKLHSYRDLPLRVAELGLVHRHELSGTLHGLMRVRCFTQDDAHLFLLPTQVKDEVIGVLELAEYLYGVFGFDYHVELSTKPEKALGSDADWERAIDNLRSALEEKGLPYQVNEGDGAFYGPKIDFHLKDALGRTWQCGTIQLDFQMPERFDLTYVGEDGGKHRPVMLHRTIFGSLERFIAILVEHYAGAFPAWLAPVQAKVMTISDRQVPYAKQVFAELHAAEVRVAADLRPEKIGYKIRSAQLEQVPYMLVIGDAEVEKGLVAVRHRRQGDLGQMSLADFQARLKEEVHKRE